MEENKYIKTELSEYELPYEDIRAEYFKNYNFGNGVECVVYVPENVNPDTKISVYYPGAGFKSDWYSGHHGSGNLSVQDYLMQNGSENIVVMPHSNNASGRIECAVEMIDLLREEYNLQSTETSYSGFSYGASPALETAALNIQRNPEIGPQVCVTVDGYNDFFYNPNNEISKVAETFKENGTILLAIESRGKKDILKNYAEAGINVIKVTYQGDGIIDLKYGDKYTYRNDGGNTHVAINQHYFKDGFSEFISGNSQLPAEGYTYQYYDLETGEWVNIDPTLINTYDKLNAFYGNDIFLINVNKLASLSTIDIVNLSVTSNSQVLTGHINNIIGNIKNSNFVQNGINYDASFASTTKVPSSIPSIVKEFYSANATLLLKIANEVKEFAKIGESIDKIDKETKEETIELGNVITTTGSPRTDNKSQIEQTTSEIVPEKNEIPVSPPISNGENKQEETVKEETKEPEQKTDNKELDEKVEAKQPEDKIEPPTPNNQTPNSDETKNESPSPNTTPNTDVSEKKETNPLDEFPEYKEVYSDESKIVYDYNNEYRIIVHKDGDEIIGIEHYYKFDNELVADKALETLSTKYANNENIENIIQKGSYVKVVFKEEMYENLTINEIRNQYKDLSEVIKTERNGGYNANI